MYMNDNTQLHRTQQLAMLETYINNGWRLVPITPGSKAPSLKQWQFKKNTIGSVDQLNPDLSYGLAHAYSGTMALDIDNWTRACTELEKYGINLPKLYTSKDAVAIHSGKNGHAKLIYQMPKGVVLQSKKLIDTDACGKKYNYLDFRCATQNGTCQDVLPPSIHPETLNPYQWVGHGDWRNPPLIPDELLQYWKNLIEPPVYHAETQEVNSNPSDVRDALYCIPPSIDRDSWVKIGMALHWFGTQHNDNKGMFSLYNDWSARSHEKYKGLDDVKTVWRSFGSSPVAITIATLFDYAYQYGYKPKVSIEGMFSNVGEQSDSQPKLFDLRILTEPTRPELDFNIIPGILRDRSLEVSQYTGCDPLSPLWAGIATICAAVDNQSSLELNSTFIVNPIMWMMSIGDSSSKKSVGYKDMLPVLDDIRRSDAVAFKRRHLEWQGKEAAYNQAHAEYLKYCSSPDALLSNDLPPHVPELPPEPQPLALKLSDVTSQKLVRICASQPRGVMCHLDEMFGWIKKLTSSNSGEDRSCWVQAYEGSSYRMDRVADGTIEAENMAVSLLGNIQTEILTQNKDLMKSDGLLQRFMPCVLSKTFEVGDMPPPLEFTLDGQWRSTIIDIYSLPRTRYELCSEASKAFRSFQFWHKDLINAESQLGADPVYVQTLGKIPALCGRLALVFHLIVDPRNTKVSVETLNRAISMIKNYHIPVLRYLSNVIYGGDVENLTLSIIRHIAYHSNEPTITLRDIKRAMAKKLEKYGNNTNKVNDLVMESMLVLESANWAKLEVNTNRSVVWSIHPNLQHEMAEYRQQLIDNRQKLLDSIAQAVYEKTGVMKKYKA